MDNDHSRPFPNTGSGPAMNTAAPQPMQQASADEEDEGLALLKGLSCYLSFSCFFHIS
jgi:hypothetical protein